MYLLNILIERRKVRIKQLEIQPKVKRRDMVIEREKKGERETDREVHNLYHCTVIFENKNYP